MATLLLDGSKKSNKAEPRFETMRNPARPTVGHKVAKIAEALGVPLMPWQKHWALVAGEMVQDEELGIWVPAYDEDFVTVMRQSGKTFYIVSRYLTRALTWESWDRRPQNIAYTAQNGSEAYKKFRKEHVPLFRASKDKIWPTISAVRHTAGDRGLDFVNGSIMTIWATTEEAGHGSTIDLGIMDEIFADQNNDREQAMVPAQATRHDAQNILASTAGDESSYFYLRKQRAGRSAVTEGLDRGMCYLEYSADPDDPDFDPESPALWAKVMPALGHTISVRTVQNALRKMKEDKVREGGTEADALAEFCRAWLNITKRRGSSRVFPDQVWASVLKEVAPTGTLVLAVDSQPDQSTSSIAAVDTAYRAEIVDHGDGVGWLLERLVALAKSLDAPVAVDTAGPVGDLVPKLGRVGVEVIKLAGQEINQVCSEMHQRVADGRVHIRPTRCEHCGMVTITEAAKGAVKLERGDGWRWARKSTQVDISPLMALSLGVGAVAGIGGWKPTGVPLFAWAK